MRHRRPLTLSLSITLVLIIATCLSARSRGEGWLHKVNRDPDAAKLVTSDLDNFWHAYDLAAGAANSEEKEKIFQREYLDKASPGLKDFLHERIKSVKFLVRVMDARPKYYAALRNQTPRINEMGPAIHASFRKLKELYSDAVFPDVYFLIGDMNSGGTTGGSGLLLGVEITGRTPETDMSEMDSWLKQVIMPIDSLPYIVAHELIHDQQGPEHRSLLALSVREGGADFIAEMISGGYANVHQHQYGEAHEAELWREFSDGMDKKDFSRWLYQGDKSKDRPADLGYFMGYRIAQSYYEHAADKTKAIRDIITVHDFGNFLRESHYADKFSGQ